MPSDVHISGQGGARWRGDSRVGGSMDDEGLAPEVDAQALSWGPPPTSAPAWRCFHATLDEPAAVQTTFVPFFFHSHLIVPRSHLQSTSESESTLHHRYTTMQLLFEH